MDLLVLQRFTQGFEDIFGKVGQLIEEENPFVRECYFADFRLLRPSAEDGGAGRSMMGCLIGR